MFKIAMFLVVKKEQEAGQLFVNRIAFRVFAKTFR